MKNDQAPFEVLLIDEFAERLKIGKATVHAWKKKGILKAGKHYIKRGGIIRFFWEKNLLLNLNEDTPKSSTGKDAPDTDNTLPKERQAPGKIGINLEY